MDSICICFHGNHLQLALLKRLLQFVTLIAWWCSLNVGHRHAVHLVIIMVTCLMSYVFSSCIFKFRSCYNYNYKVMLLFWITSKFARIYYTLVLYTPAQSWYNTNINTEYVFLLPMQEFLEIKYICLMWYSLPPFYLMYMYSGIPYLYNNSIYSTIVWLNWVLYIEKNNQHVNYWI